MEYAILLGIVTAALLGMQVYAKRGIQAGIQMAADQIGSQRDGLVDSDPDFEWKRVGCSQVTSDTISTQDTDVGLGGTVTYDRAQAATRSGLLSDPSC